MSCFDELTLSLYADGELDAAHAKRVGIHLAQCGACRQRSRALVIEEASLRAALADEVSVAVLIRAWSRWWLAATIAVVVGFSTGVALLRQPPLPAAFSWLEPVSIGVGQDLLTTVAFVLMRRGATTIPFALALGLLGVVVALSRWRRATAAAAVTLLLSLLVTNTAGATEVRTAQHGQSTVVVPVGETIDDTLLISGDTVIIEGTVNGDVIALGGQVRLSGTSRGSLMCLARRLDLDGVVGGDVYAMADSIGVRGRIERNVHLAVKRADLAIGSTIGHDLIALAQEARLAGLVGRDARARTNGTELAGQVGRNAHVTSDRVLVEDSAAIGGNLLAAVPNRQDVQIASGAQIRGDNSIADTASRKALWQIRGPRYVPHVFVQPSFYFWQGLRLAAALMAGALLFWVAPVCFEPRVGSGRALGTAMGLGFLVLVATPIATLVAALTIVGLPIAFALTFAWLAVVYLSGVFAAGWIGRLILRPVGSGLRPFLLTLLVGQILLRIAVHLPFIDSALWTLALVLGVGLATVSVPRLWQRVHTS